MHRNKNILGLKLSSNINELYKEIKSSSPASTPPYSPRQLPRLPVLSEIVSFLSHSTSQSSKREFEYSFREGNAVETHKLVPVVSASTNKTTIKYEAKVEFGTLGEATSKYRGEIFNYQNECELNNKSNGERFDQDRPTSPISPKSSEFRCIKDCVCLWM